MLLAVLVLGFGGAVLLVSGEAEAQPAWQIDEWRHACELGDAEACELWREAVERPYYRPHVVHVAPYPPPVHRWRVRRHVVPERRHHRDWQRPRHVAPAPRHVAPAPRHHRRPGPAMHTARRHRPAVHGGGPHRRRAPGRQGGRRPR